jgi:uncharacterized membrane protein YkgB
LYTFIEFLCLIGILFFIIMGIISFFKMNGKSLKNFIITGALFVLFIFTSFTDPSNEAEHSKLETVQKEKTKRSKTKNNENVIKSCKNRVGCKSKSDKAPFQEPKKVKIEKETYRIVFMVYGLM